MPTKMPVFDFLSLPLLYQVPRSNVCHFCARRAGITPRLKRHSVFSKARFQHTDSRLHSQKSHSKTPASRHNVVHRPAKTPRPVQDVKALLEVAASILETDTAPSPQATVESLEICRDLAASMTTSAEQPVQLAVSKRSAANQLLNLEPGAAIHHERPALSNAMEAQATRSEISTVCYRIVTDPKTFLTPEILELYVETQSLLGATSTLGEIFRLYAEKPVPEAGSKPVKYLPAKPNAMDAAVPLATAKLALDAAARARDLPACLDIIDNTVAKPAFRKRRAFQYLLAPGLGLSLAPLGAYVLASQFAAFQETMSNESATRIAFAGILTYVGCTAGMGMIAISTANDQMDRVSWALGRPLRERWLREDERAMFDRIACAWGFKDVWRRGEEESADWQALKQIIGLRGMVLDKASLMQDME